MRNVIDVNLSPSLLARQKRPVRVHSLWGQHGQSLVFLSYQYQKKTHLDVEDVLQILDFPSILMNGWKCNRNVYVVGRETRVRLSSQSAIKEGSWVDLGGCLNLAVKNQLLDVGYVQATVSSYKIQPPSLSFIWWLLGQSITHGLSTREGDCLVVASLRPW